MKQMMLVSITYKQKNNHNFHKETMNHNKAPQSTNFEATESGLLLPSGHENNVNPAESALNSAMHIGMSEQGLGSVKYGETSIADAKNEANEKAFTDMLNPANVIELKSAIDHAVERANAEESHLGNTKDGSKQAREAKTADSLTNKLVNEYMHIGDKEGDREFPEPVRKDLSRLLGKSYKELEAMIDKAEAKKAGPSSAKNSKAGTKAVSGSDSAESSDAENKAGKSNSTKTEMVVTTDLEEAKAYWENNIKQQGIPLEDYLSHEKAWLVAREVEADEPEVPVEPTPIPQPPVKPVTLTPPVEPKPVAPRPIKPEGEDTREAPKPEKSSRRKKVLATMIAGLALLGLAAGPEDGRRNSWNVKIPGIEKELGWSGLFDIDTNDSQWDTNWRGNIDAVPDIDEADNVLGEANVDLNTREEIDKNFKQAENFFETISTSEGSESFESLEKFYDQTMEQFKQKWPNLSNERLEELVKADVSARLAALNSQSLKEAANK